MVIHFLKDDCLTALKTNIAGNIKHYSDPTNDWIYEFFDGENPFLEYKFQIDDFQFDTELNDVHDQSKQDVENVIRLYSVMKNITDTQATDERLWAGLAHGDFWPYMSQRWGDKCKTQNSVKTCYFLNLQYNLKRALFINKVSRMWWIGRLTYDENRKDPFELTKYMESNFSTKSLVIFSSNYMSSPTVAHGLFAALIELEQSEGISSKKRQELYYQATRYLNIFGGSHILDYYTEEEIKDKVLNYMHSLKG